MNKIFHLIYYKMTIEYYVGINFNKKEKMLLKNYWNLRFLNIYLRRNFLFVVFKLTYLVYLVLIW
jgi:hypothetical protein